MSKLSDTNQNFICKVTISLLKGLNIYFCFIQPKSTSGQLHPKRGQLHPIFFFTRLNGYFITNMTVINFAGIEFCSGHA